MAKPFYATVPQRSDGHGYVDCLPHRATSWAVRKSERIRRGQRYYTASVILSRHTTRTQADGARDHHERSMEKPKQNYKLGQRMGIRVC